MPDATFRQYLTIKPLPDARARSVDDLYDLVRNLLNDLGAPRTLLLPGSYSISDVPSHDWTPQIVGWLGADPIQLDPDEIVVPCTFTDPDRHDEFRDAVLPAVDQRLASGTITAIGADPGGSVADHYCPVHDGAAFATRREARRLLALESLPPDLDELVRGRPKVNVVILDQGLHKGAIPDANWGGGWAYKLGTPNEERLPGSSKANSHGAMVARNVLDIAPSAVLYDFPLIPPERIPNVSMFASHANAGYIILRKTIALLRQDERWRGPWIVVNAWGIFDRRSERPIGDYTEDTNRWGHPLNKAVGRTVADRIDVVFAAGNCGQFSMSPRCGPSDRGSGRSIWGANSHRDVITVGAVLTDEKWLGYSAQGPGQRHLDPEKPDVCAPSQFRDTNDPALLNTGTSAACALAAGVLATLRSNWDANVVGPAEMKRVLAKSARKAPGSELPGHAGERARWRFGAGIIDAGKAWAELSGTA